MPTVKRNRKHQIIYIGIDPGVSGGIAIIHHGVEPVLIAMPDSEHDLWSWIRGIGWIASTPSGYYQPRRAVIEWIHPALKGASKSTMSKLYGNYMQCRGFLTAAGIPFDVVMPTKWQSALNIQKRKKTESRTEWKNRLRSSAQRLYPGHRIWESTKTLQLQISDALLIATYCQRLHGG